MTRLMCSASNPWSTTLFTFSACNASSDLVVIGLLGGVWEGMIGAHMTQTSKMAFIVFKM